MTWAVASDIDSTIVAGTVALALADEVISRPDLECRESREAPRPYVDADDINATV